MKPGANNERVYRMAFASVYPHYVAKAEKKGRTKEELYTIIHWLTGYDEKALQQVLAKKTDFETFFAQAPRINPNVSKITGVICGYRVEDPAVQRDEDPLMQQTCPALAGSATWTSWWRNWPRARRWTRS